MAVIQRMASIEVLPLGNYNGTHVLGGATGIQVADDVTSVDISIARCTSATPTIWPNASTVLDIKPEVSCDDGVTWIESGRSISPGGISFIKGQQAAFSISGGSLPPAVNGIARRYRCTVAITGGPLRSSMTVEVN